MEKQIVTVFDVGTTHMTVLVARCAEEIAILGATSVPCSAMRKGTMVNLEGATNSIHDALDEVERQTGLEIEGVRVSVSGVAALGDNLEEELSLRGGEVKATDIDKLAGLARAHKPQPGFEFIHLLPGNFLLDGKSGVENPVGMYGTELSCIHHRVQYPSAELKNLIRAFNNAGLKVQQFGYEPLTAAEGVLTPDEKELGVLSINLGASLTHMAIYSGGTPIHCKDLPVAAHHVTKDLAIGLRTTLVEAERIKREHGLAFTEGMAPFEPVEIHSMDADLPRVVARREVCGIVEARMREILQAALQELKKQRLGSYLGKGIVLSGGGALLGGVVPLAEGVFGMPCRLGLPLQAFGITDSLRTPSAATAFGLISHVFSSVQAQPAFAHGLDRGKGGLLNLSKSLISRLVDPFI